jgi:hypothetical protein
MGVDPVSIGFGLSPYLERALKKYKNQNEVRRFFYELKGAVQKDRAIPEESRKALADRLFYLLADPNFLSPLERYLEHVDQSVLPTIEEFIRPITYEIVADDRAEAVIDAAMHDVEVAANRAKKSERDAILFQTERIRGDIAQLAQRSAPVALLDVEWAPDWPQKALTDLGKASPAELAELRARLGKGDDLNVIERAIREPDEWLSAASGHVWIAVARFAENFGEWLLAMEAWDRALRDPPKADPVPILIHCAMNASIAGDDEGYKAYFERAVEIDPDHPRVRLEQAASINDPEAVLNILQGVRLDNPDHRALLEGHRVRAYLLLGDLEGAREYLERAQGHNGELIQIRMLEANLTIHTARIAISRNKPVDAARLLEAREQCLELRQQLLDQKRPEEAARLLMLAADATTIGGEAERAIGLLREASDEERFRGEGDEALAEAAIRARDPQLAVELLHPDKSESDSRRRIRAHAAILRPGDVESAINDLDDLVSREGPEQSFAALPRLMVSALRAVKWSDEAERLVAETDPTIAVALKAVALLGQARAEEARALLEPYAEEGWAAELLFRTAAEAGDTKAAAELAARDLERRTPSHEARLMYAAAFKDAGDLSRARAQLRSLVDDDRTPLDVKKQAFQGLVWLADDIPTRFDILKKWQESFPDDPNVAREFAHLDKKLRD